MAAPLVRMRDAGGTLRTMTRIRMRDAGGTLRTITRIRMRDEANVLQIVYDPTGVSTLDVSPSPDSVWGITAGTGTATTGVVTASASGGTAPYTYAWTCLAFDAGVTPTATSPSTAATAFTQTSMNPSEAYTSTWQITVTDANSNTATDTVTANFADAT